MKKSRIVLIVSAICAVVLCLSLFVHWNSLHKIDAERVEKIQLGNAPTSVTFNAEDTAKFIELFNSAQYAGKGTGEGGTPDWIAFVYYQDGSYLTISEFGGAGRSFEVFLRDANRNKKAWYYVNSEELESFLSRWGYTP